MLEVIHFHHSGTKSLENALTSDNWKELSAETGTEDKLVFISPELSKLAGLLISLTIGQIYSRSVESSVFDITSCCMNNALYCVDLNYPFEESSISILQAVLSRPLSSPSLSRPDIYSQLFQLLDKVTAEQPKMIYHSARELRHGLYLVVKSHKHHSLWAGAMLHPISIYLRRYWAAQRGRANHQIDP